MLGCLLLCESGGCEVFVIVCERGGGVVVEAEWAYGGYLACVVINGDEYEVRVCCVELLCEEVEIGRLLFGGVGCEDGGKGCEDGGGDGVWEA